MVFFEKKNAWPQSLMCAWVIKWISSQVHLHLFIDLFICIDVSITFGNVSRLFLPFIRLKKGFISCTISRLNSKCKVWCIFYTTIKNPIPLQSKNDDHTQNGFNIDLELNQKLIKFDFKSLKKR